jgi:hypothetical protein
MMEERLVNATIGLLFLGVVAVQIIKIANAWVAATEDYRDALEIQTMQNVANWQVLVAESEEDEEDLGPEYN